LEDTQILQRRLTSGLTVLCVQPSSSSPSEPLASWFRAVAHGGPVWNDLRLPTRARRG
jgi:hypothetical protein